VPDGAAAFHLGDRSGSDFVAAPEPQCIVCAGNEMDFGCRRNGAPFNICDCEAASAAQ
jgi:hypothetical protein